MNISCSKTLENIRQVLEENSGIDKETLRDKLGIDNNVLTGYLNELDWVLFVKDKTGRTSGETIRNATSDDKINEEKLRNFNIIVHEFGRLVMDWNERTGDWRSILERFAKLITANEEQVMNLFEFTSTFYTMIWFDINKFHVFKAHDKEFPLIAQDIKDWTKERVRMFEDVTAFIASREKLITEIIFKKSYLKMENCSMIQIVKMYAIDRKSNF